MKNLTTPQSILFGLGLIALAIASVTFSSKIVSPAVADYMYGKKERPFYVHILSYKEK